MHLFTSLLEGICLTISHLLWGLLLPSLISTTTITTVVWGFWCPSQVDTMGRGGREAPLGPGGGHGAARPWFDGGAARRPCSTSCQYLGVSALQNWHTKRFKEHPGSSRSWVVVWRLYSRTEGLNMVIVNLCPFVGLIPDLFPSLSLLGLSMHQISWVLWVIL